MPRVQMGFLYNLPFVVLVSVGTALYLAPRRSGRRGSVAADLARRAEPFTRPLFAFFGLPASPPAPVVGIAAAVAGAAGLALGALGRAVVGPSPLLALTTLATAIGVGLLAAKIAHERPGAGPRIGKGPETA